jgi:putative transport protein
MEWLTQLLTDDSIAHAVFIISLVTFLGLALGSLHFRGLSLGIAGVLFVGILFGHFNISIDRSILEFAREFGLILFVYTIGMQVGPGFFASLKQQGLKLNLLAALVVLSGAAIAIGIHYLGGLQPAVVVGLFSGSTTNTPSLGSAMEALRSLPGTTDETLKLPGQAYAVAYPFGIIGIILSMFLIRRIFKVNLDKEHADFTAERETHQPKLANYNIEVTNENLNGLTINQLPGTKHLSVVVSRILREGVLTAGQTNLSLRVGDILHVVGIPHDVQEFLSIVGKPSDMDLKTLPGPLLTRRMLVTKQGAIGKRIQELHFEERFNATITRVARSEVEFSSALNARLMFGDTVIVVGRKEDLERIEKELGNSAKQMTHPHVIPIFVGIALGILVGMFPIHIEGLPAPFKLGLAGGPLLVAILLSRLGSFGSLVWHMPISANFMLREVGIVLFLSAVGLKAGHGFVETLVAGDGLLWMFLASIITLVPLLLAAFIGRVFCKLNYMSLCGLLSGSMTDPPALAFANAATKSDAPSIAYATVYPLTMLLRIFCAQLIIILLS